MSGSSVLQVVILRSGSLVGTEMLVPGDYRVGRDPSCEIHIDEPTLSRVHARLVFNGTRVGVQDLGSDNGISINGEKVQAREVKSLDDVMLGKLTLKLKVIGRKDDAPTDDRPALDRTVPLAARPNSAQLRAALEPVPSPPPARAHAGTQVESDPDITSPGQPPGMAMGGGGVPSTTQPSARRAQVAPDLQPAPAPPRPVIGLVPPPTAPARKSSPPAAPQKVPVATTRSTPKAKGSFEATVAKAGPAKLTPPEAEPPPGNQPSVRVRVAWGDQMLTCRTFAYGTPVIAAERESAPLPVYGFGLTKATTLCQVGPGGWAVRVPRSAIVEVFTEDRWAPAQPSREGKDEVLPLPPTGKVRLRQGRLAVELSAVAPQATLPKKRFDLELSLLVPLVAGLAAAVSLVAFMPKNLDVPDFVPQKLPGIRPALLAPPPKPKTPPKQKQKLAEKKSEKKPVARARPQPHARPQHVEAPAAVAALEKLTSSPAMRSLLAATGRHGGGRPNGLKMVGLKGIGPVALAGMGLGSGGGFGGGPVTRGREQLRGIGALGIGHALKGSPGGVVVQAPARQAQVHGSLSRDQIAKVINAHMQQIRACYERALLRDPGLTGKLVIEWDIDLSGAVSSFKTKSSSLRNPVVGECILDNLKSWRFPRPTGGSVVVSYPFVFNSVGF